MDATEHVQQGTEVEIAVILGGGFDVPRQAKSPGIRGKGTVIFRRGGLVIRGTQKRIALPAILIAGTIVAVQRFDGGRLWREIGGFSPLVIPVAIAVLYWLFHLALRQERVLEVNALESKVLYDHGRHRACVQIGNDVWVTFWAVDPSKNSLVFGKLTEAFGDKLVPCDLKPRII